MSSHTAGNADAGVVDGSLAFDDFYSLLLCTKIYVFQGDRADVACVLMGLCREEIDLRWGQPACATQYRVPILVVSAIRTLLVRRFQC